MAISRRDLLNDMAEHRPILKNNQNTYQPGFGFIQNRYGIPQNAILILLCMYIVHPDLQCIYLYLTMSSNPYCI